MTSIELAEKNMEFWKRIEELEGFNRQLDAENRMLEAKVRELSEMIVDSVRTMKDRNL